MFILPFVCPPIETNAYLIACDSTRHAAIVDPGFGSFDSVKHFCEEQNYQLKMVLCTHSHWDHIAEVFRFHNELRLPVYVHADDAFNLIQPGRDGLPMPFSIQGCQPTHTMVDGEEITLGHLSCKVLHTPGHSIGSVCFYFAQEAVLLSGDTLFKGTMGKTSFPTSSPEEMAHSLALLAQLPSATKVYPGHGPQTTIGAESWI